MAVDRQIKIVTSDDLDAELRAIVNDAAEYGERAEQAARDAGKTIRRFEDKPGDVDETVAQLRHALEDEIQIAQPIEGDAIIDVGEQDREIAKRALVHIKLSTLRQIAKGLDIPHSGNLDAVTDRIARKLKADRAEIARLVLQYETEPPPERRFTSRVFQLWESPGDLDALASRIDYVLNRYIRIGIARWFVLENVQRSASSLVLSGIFRFFKADADQSDDDLTLRAEEGSASAQLRVRGNEPIAEVQAKGERESKAIMAAFEGTSECRRREALKIGTESMRGHLAGWDAWSVFLVDLLGARFRSPNIEILNLTHAGFRTDDGGSEEANRPTIKAVRLEGRHLLDSRAACELLTRGQSLAELGMTVRYRLAPSQDVSLPLTVKLSKDHATILTGFGITEPSNALKCHAEVVAGVSSSLRHGLADEVSLSNLAREIANRASSDEAPSKATIFAPPDDDGSE